MVKWSKVGLKIKRLISMGVLNGELKPIDISCQISQISFNQKLLILFLLQLLSTGLFNPLKINHP